ncbi:MAG TPA: hypothetical protein VE398_04520, partial [Acidobacteriota bacterium]|nr:hypothetical protein [Acidobacteriota bacterium]
MDLKGKSKPGSKCGVAVTLLAVFFLSSACFQEDQTKSRGPQLTGLGPESIWPLSNAGARAPSVRSVAAEQLTLTSGAWAYGRGISESPGEPFALYSTYPIGSRSDLARSAGMYRIGAGAAAFRSSHSQRDLSMEAAAAAFFNKPLGLLFASIFKKTGVDASTLADASTDDTRNPFREARKAESKAADAAESAKSSAVNPAPTADRAANPSTPKTDTGSTIPPNPISAASPPEPRFAFIGDFDGSGVLRVVQARRLDEATFSFPDAVRTFTV